MVRFDSTLAMLEKAALVGAKIVISDAVSIVSLRLVATRAPTSEVNPASRAVEDAFAGICRYESTMCTMLKLISPAAHTPVPLRCA